MDTYQEISVRHSVGGWSMSKIIDIVYSSMINDTILFCTVQLKMINMGLLSFTGEQDQQGLVFALPIGGRIRSLGLQGDGLGAVV